MGDNEPYDGALRGDTMFKHAIVNGFAHALIEIRQDLISDDQRRNCNGQKGWRQLLTPSTADPIYIEVKQFGSRTGPL